ncbi:MAG: integrase [Pseudohongiellaceae bacterium]|jgi:integrase
MLKVMSDSYSAALFVRKGLELVLFPSFFSHMLSQTGVVYKLIETCDKNGFVTATLIEKEVDDVTINIIINRMHTFLKWVEEYSLGSTYISVATHHNLSSKILNYYINDILIVQKKVSEAAIQQHLMALNAYYNYLARAGFTNSKKLYVRPSLKSRARANGNPRTAVKYLTPEVRSLLCQNTKSIRDEILLRTGGELGLRSKENIGFLVNDFYVGKKMYHGMLSLFQEMDGNPSQLNFEYYLQGIYTKSQRFSGGYSRWLYIHRDLLLRMREYYEIERPQTNEDCFFVNSSPSNVGTPIAKNRATRVFTAARAVVLEKQAAGLLPHDGQRLEAGHTGHVLRHSFGTDKFYQFAEQYDIAIDDVVPTSLIYLTVARLMGHNAADRSAPMTTRIYIRSCHVKKQFEVGGSYEF